MTAIEGHSPAGIATTGPQRQRLRTDVATVLLHWTFALLLGASVVTGFRIAADAADATWSRWLSPLLLQGEVSIWHVWSALAHVACGWDTDRYGPDIDTLRRAGDP